MEASVRDLINEVARLNYLYCFDFLYELQIRYICGRGFVVDVESKLDGYGFPYIVRSVSRNEHLTEFGCPEIVLADLRRMEASGQLNSLIEYFVSDFVPVE